VGCRGKYNMPDEFAQKLVKYILRTEFKRVETHCINILEASVFPAPLSPVISTH